MITESIIAIIAFTLSVLINAVQLVDLPSSVNDAFQTVSIYFQKANAIFPIDTIFTIIGLVLAIESGILAIKLINWALNKFRGSG